VDITNEIYPGDSGRQAGPYGLGQRVPMIVVSPWSKGGWVCSEVFDHTSIIRFIEQRFGQGNAALKEHNIPAWRRAVCGDLTSAFDFARPNWAPVGLPATASYMPRDNERHPDFSPQPPARQAVPKQEQGLRPARPVPYDLHVQGQVDVAGQMFRVDFGNKGTAAACFHVRSADGQTGPWSYTVGANKSLSDSWSLATNAGAYDLSVYGPNGFYRSFQGNLAGRALLAVSAAYDVVGNAVSVNVTNQGTKTSVVIIVNGYTGETVVEQVAGGQTLSKFWPLKSSFGWYDLTVRVEGDATFKRRLGGHVETGKNSMSDPAIAGLIKLP
jgi:phospholipase C